MKRILASNNIYYLFKSSPKNGRKQHYEDIFVPKYFLNLFKLSKKKKILKAENKKYEEKDYLLNINSYFKPEQIDKINSYQKYVQKKNIKKNNRVFSANIKLLPKIKYSNNDIISCNSKNSIKKDYNKKCIKHNSTNNEIIPSSTKLNEKNNNNYIPIKNIRKIKINDYCKNNSVETSSRSKNYDNNNIKSTIRSRNEIIIPSQMENSEAPSLKSISILRGKKININVIKYKFINYNKSIMNKKINCFKIPKFDKKKDVEKISKSKIAKKKINTKYKQYKK